MTTVEPGQVVLESGLVLVGQVPMAGAGAGTGVVVVPGTGGTPATRLADLTDVETAGAAPGHALALSADGPWRAAPLAHLHEQTNPSTVWLVAHELPFPPAAVEVHDHLGLRHYPTVTHPTASTVQLAFGFDVRGTARLS